jgi:hypothetical protein
MTATTLSDLRRIVPLTLWLVGCATEGLSPGGLTGTFELRSIGGRALPAVYDSSDYGFAAAVRGSFAFTDDGYVLWAWEEQVVSRPSLTEPFGESTYTYENTHPYTLRGADLRIGDECPPDPAGNCAPPMSGRLAGGRLTLNPAFSRASWTFVRIDQ